MAERMFCRTVRGSRSDVGVLAGTESARVDWELFVTVVAISGEASGAWGAGEVLVLAKVLRAKAREPLFEIVSEYAVGSETAVAGRKELKPR